MIIKEKSFSFPKGKSKRLMKFIFLATICFVFFIAGSATNRLGIYGNIIKPIIVSNIKIIPNYILSFFSEHETIYLDVSFENWSYINKIRDQALMDNQLITSSKDFVKAKVSYDNKSYPCKIRLKGDYPDHWSGKKWSLRLKMSGDNTLFGMKKMSIQHPKTRKYLSEWFWYRLLEKENLIHLRYDFVRVVINTLSLR